MGEISNTMAARSKIVRFVRHGQAMHTPRAEPARHAGCSYEEFLRLMTEDDHFDSPLTALERAALTTCSSTLQLIVASPLSRALDTAQLIFGSPAGARKVCIEQFREINGLLLNAKRKPRDELRPLYPEWDFECLTGNDDTLWKPEALEETGDCAERGYQGLRHVWAQEETEVAIVGHGGMWSFLFNQHEQVLVDEPLKARFANCELRSFVMVAEANNADESRPVFKLSGLQE